MGVTWRVMPIYSCGERCGALPLLLTYPQPRIGEAETMAEKRHSRGSRIAHSSRRGQATAAAGPVAVFSAIGLTLLLALPAARADDDRITDVLGPPPGVVSAEGGMADAAFFDQSAALRLHDDIEPWINSPFRPEVDTSSLQHLIGDGVNGAALYPDGGDADLWFGDGGSGPAGQDGQPHEMTGAGAQNGAHNP
jgi:hypothetical protein